MHLLKVICFIAVSTIQLSAQHSILSSDSSKIIFPNNLTLPLSKSSVGGKTYFQFDKKTFKAFVLTMDYYLKENTISVENVDLLLRNQALFDSTHKILIKKFEIENERTNLYKNAYEDMKSVSSTYDKQMTNCMNDLNTLKAQKDRSKTLSFIKGFLWGTGIFGGVLAISSLR